MWGIIAKFLLSKALSKAMSGGKGPSGSVTPGSMGDGNRGLIERTGLGASGQLESLGSMEQNKYGRKYTR